MTVSPSASDFGKCIVLSTWTAKNGVDTNARVKSQDPTEESFPVFVARWIGEIKEGAIVLVRKLDNLTWPAIVEVLGIMPMPISLAGLKDIIFSRTIEEPDAELEYNSDMLITNKELIEKVELVYSIEKNQQEYIEKMQSNSQYKSGIILRILSLLRDED